MYYLIKVSTLFLAKNIFFHNQLNQPKLRFEISGYWKFCESVMAAWVAMRRRANQQWRRSLEPDRSKSVDQKQFTTQF